MLDSVTFSSFKHPEIRRVKELLPSARTAALFESPVQPNFLQVTQDLKAEQVDLRYDEWTAERVQVWAQDWRGLGLCRSGRRAVLSRYQPFHQELQLTSF